MDETFGMEMPTPCRHCGGWFDLNNGRGSEKWYPGTVICDACCNKEEEEIEEEERWRDINDELSDGLFPFEHENAWEKLTGENLERLKSIPVLTALQLERTDRYWYYCGRNNREFVETTYWYNPVNRERTETTRRKCFFPSEEWEMPEWCKGITEHRKNLDAQYY